MSLMVKIILSGFPPVLLLSAAAKTKCFDHLFFNSILQLVNGISSDSKINQIFFKSTGMVACFIIPLLLFGAG